MVGNKLYASIYEIYKDDRKWLACWQLIGSNCWTLGCFVVWYFLCLYNFKFLLFALMIHFIYFCSQAPWFPVCFVSSFRMAFAPSTTAVGPVSTRLHHLHWGGDVSISSFSQSRFRRSDKKTRNGFLFMDVKAVAAMPDIDFKDPNWKKHFQEDWDRRFNLPHLTDILDPKPRPTTFSLKTRLLCPVLF